MDRDLSFLDENGTKPHNKTMKMLKKCSDKIFEEYKLRILISICCRSVDVSRASSLFHDAIKNNIPLDLSMCQNLINLLSGLGVPGSGNSTHHILLKENTNTDTTTANLVFNYMKENELKRSEAVYTALIRNIANSKVDGKLDDENLLNNNGRNNSTITKLACDRALALYEELKNSDSDKNRPRHRTLSPLLEITCRDNRVEQSMIIYNEIMYKYKFNMTEKDYIHVLALLIRQDVSHHFYPILRDCMEDVFVPKPMLRRILCQWFTTGNRASLFYISSSLVSVDGIVSCNQQRLKSISLTNDNRNTILQQLKSQISSKSKGKFWPHFENWLQIQQQIRNTTNTTTPSNNSNNINYYDSIQYNSEVEKFNCNTFNFAFDSVIDGANVGYFETNFSGAANHVDYRQIEWIRRTMELAGHKPMIVLHQRHVLKLDNSNGKNGSYKNTDAPPTTTTKNNTATTTTTSTTSEKVTYLNSNNMSATLLQAPPDMQSLVCHWANNLNCLYITPAGSNDDWYWMYITVYFHLTKLVSNDHMRDHHFQMLSPRWFQRWKERHQVRFSLGKWVSINSDHKNNDKRNYDSETTTNSSRKMREVFLQHPLSYSHRAQCILPSSDRSNNRSNGVSVNQTTLTLPATTSNTDDNEDRKADPECFEYYIPTSAVCKEDDEENDAEDDTEDQTTISSDPKNMRNHNSDWLCILRYASSPSSSYSNATCNSKQNATPTPTPTPTSSSDASLGYDKNTLSLTENKNLKRKSEFG